MLNIVLKNIYGKNSIQCMINQRIFKNYDIRGKYPSEINDDSAYLIGKAIVVLLKARQVIVGHDMRTSSPSLLASLTKGIIEEGADVLDIGLCSTSQFYYAMQDEKAGAM